MAVGGAQRARARAMVRLVMVRLGMAPGTGHATCRKAAMTVPSPRLGAAGRSSSNAYVVHLDAPPRRDSSVTLQPEETATTDATCRDRDRETIIDLIIGRRVEAALAITNWLCNLALTSPRFITRCA